MDGLARIADELRTAETAAVLTGAGISAPSGVPTFRGEDGIWGEEFDVSQFHYDRFRADPAAFWSDRLDLRAEMGAGSHDPNAGHRALADLTEAGILDAVITQNVDGLHQQASNEGEILELHGSGARVRCESCGTTADSAPISARAMDGELPPRCSCGGVYKPDVVLFGERLPSAVLERSQALAEQSDVFLAVGSSLVVEPAASLPRIAATTGATLAIVNLESTPCDGQASVCWQDDVTTVLPRLVEAVLEQD
ncbi:MAG: NAD-dependent protein deacylase [Natrialbaceae archaeon]|nr:NAD-dependent protein deacylase [Natrialbaceae archaeon]